MKEEPKIPMNQIHDMIDTIIGRNYKYFIVAVEKDVKDADACVFTSFTPDATRELVEEIHEKLQTNTQIVVSEEYEIWVEGHAIGGDRGKAQRIGNIKYGSPTFEMACRLALEKNGWEMKFYNKENNTYWGCRFFDNEADARKSFG